MNKYNLNGLTDKEVIESKKKYGTNEIIRENKNSFFNLLIESLGDPIIKILLVALLIKIVFLFKDFDWFETIGILVAIFLSSFISTISEYGSEKAFEKLKEEQEKLTCKVIRNNKTKEIFVNDVVVGDIVLLESGDKVPADGILLEGELSVDESSINGESKEIHKEKYINKIKDKNKIYRGTIIYSGLGKIYITKVGRNTFYGKIASELEVKSGDSPLKIRLRKLAKIISTFGYIGAFLASISYFFSVIILDNNFVLKDIIATLTNVRLMIDYIIYALTLSVTIIIVSVPEGLPMMITLVLSSNMKRMLKNKVLVRKMVGIETSGNINILFTDKTGTITTGNLICSEIIDGNLNIYKKEDDLKNNNYTRILKTSMLVNNSSIYDNGKVIGGNSTDKSLVSFFKPFKIDGIKKIKTIPFNSKNKYMITVIDDSKIRNLIKGAPELILEKCNYYYDNNGNKKVFKNKREVEKIIINKTKQGSRVIALATSNSNNEQSFSNLSFVSMVIIKDEIRKEAKSTIEKVSNAGIQTVMITGDNKDTAVVVAKEVGLIKKDADVVLTSEELNKITDKELKKIMPNLRVVARSLPQDKSRLVRVSQEMNMVVGMTGDGVNDAPALKKADVGFGFGSGSEVAKEASDIVILDNNFLSIYNAILYGRTIFKSIRKFIIFQLTVNLCALIVSIIGPFIGVDAPITVIQMLWINMVMDTLAGLAFSYEAPLLEYMNEPPKKKEENIINSYMISSILVTGLYTLLLLIIFLKLPFLKHIYKENESFMTAFFGLFIFCGIYNLFNTRTTRINIFSNIIKNKMFIIVVCFIIIVQLLIMYHGGTMFRTTPLNIKQLILIIFISSSVILVDTIRKIVSKKRGKIRTM